VAYGDSLEIIVFNTEGSNPSLSVII
jgi:hypothetical protein